MEGDGQFRQGVLPEAGGTGSCEVTTSSNKSVRTDSPDVMSQLTVDSNRYKFEKENFNAMVVEQKVPVRLPLIICPFFSWELDFAFVSLSLSLSPPLPPPPSCLIFYLFLSCFVLSSLVYSCLVWSLLICFWPGRVFFDSNNPFLSELCVICVQRFHSLCVNHVLPYITLPLFSHTRFTIPLHLKEKSEAQNLCDKCN